MSNFDNISKKIWEMRQELYEIINEKENILDIEVIIASQKLDDILNEYNKLLNKEKNEKQR